MQVRCASTVAQKEFTRQEWTLSFLCIPSPVSPKGRSAGFPSSCCSRVREWCRIGGKRAIRQSHRERLTRRVHVAKIPLLRSRLLANARTILLPTLTSGALSCYARGLFVGVSPEGIISRALGARPYVPTLKMPRVLFWVSVCFASCAPLLGG